MNYQHKGLASGRWFEMSLAEQLGNIGSEVHRSIKWFKAGDSDRLQGAFDRALELFDLTLADNRWNGRRKEITRSREVFCSLIFEKPYSENLDDELKSLDTYFTAFAYYARSQK